MNNEIFGTGVSVQAKVNDDYITIGCAISCNWEFENEIIGKTNVNSGLFRKKRVRISDMRGAVHGVTTSGNTPTKLSIFHFLQEAVRRSDVDMRFLFEDVSGVIKTISGLFLVQAINLTGDISSFSEFDLNLEGNGDMTVTDTADPGEVICDEIKSDWWTTTPGETGIAGVGNAGLSFAGHEVIEVDREGTQHDIVSTGTPGNRQAKYTGGASITFDPANPFNIDEKVFVIWVESGS